MPIAMAFMGNASEPQYAGIMALADGFHDAVNEFARARGIARSFFPILRPANFHIIADVQQIHIVYSLGPVGGLPLVSVTDLTQQGITTPLTGNDAGAIVQRDLGWGNCQVISMERRLVDVAEDERKAACEREAEEYYATLLIWDRSRRGEEEARALLAIPADNIPTGLLTGVQAALADASYDRGVFVMMRYRESENYEALERAIISELKHYGLVARLAKNKAYSDDLWENVRIYMHACRYGIAVFEEIDERSFNPNVAMELGYMYATGRRVLLLKDKRMPTMPTDIVGRIYRTFDTYKIAESVAAQIKAWAENDLNLLRRVSE